MRLLKELDVVTYLIAKADTRFGSPPTVGYRHIDTLQTLAPDNTVAFGSDTVDT